MQRTLVLAAAVAAIVTAANASQGAYFSQSWGWVALAFLVPTTLLLILDRVETPGRLRVTFAAPMAALGVWIALSSLWSISTSASVRETERALVYVAVALAIAFVLRRGDGPGVVGGVLLGTTLVSGYGLATRLFPDHFDSYDDPINTYRLAAPLGYWNALGILATLGIVVALGAVVHARRSAVALAAAAVMPVLALTLYFTFSRGAVGALFIGVVVAAAVDPRRLRFLWVAAALAIPALLCVMYASRRGALTTEDAPPLAAAREGHRVAVVLCMFVVVSVLAGLVARVLAARVRFSHRTTRVVDAALVATALVGAIVALVAVGGPSGLQRRFDADPVARLDLNDRLLSISGNGRSKMLGVAWRAWREKPVLGHGAGSFEYLWYEDRPSRLVVRDAHSLYVETLAELGVVGLALVSGTLLVLVVGGWRGRRRRFVPAAFGAFAAWAAASALDWHWEMVGVTVAALLLGSVGLVASERGRARALPSSARTGVMVAAGLLSVLAVWSLVGNQALFAGREAVARKEWVDARRDARRAHALLSWSYEPDLVLGDAAAGLGDRAGAVRAYRDAVAMDPDNWVAWLRLAQVSRGAERRAAYERVRQLNPREEGLPGE